jgi:hypothetical protein
MRIGILALLFSLVLFGFAPVCLPAEQGSPDAILQNLLTAIQSSDIAKFTAQATPEFKTRVTQDILNQAHGLINGKMNGGYTYHYLGDIKAKGDVTYLYKIEFKDGTDDVLARLIIRDGLVAGFIL